MPEINLLPDELRGKEEKELKSVHKKPKVFKIEMSSPPKEKVKQPLKTSRPSLLSRLFSKKIKPAESLSEPPESVKPKPAQVQVSEKVEKVLHIPKAPAIFGKLKPDSSSLAAASNKEAEEEAEEKVKTTEEVKFSSRQEKVVASVPSPPDEPKPLDFARDKPLDFARDKPLDFARDKQKSKKKFRIFGFGNWLKIFKRSKKKSDLSRLSRTKLRGATPSVSEGESRGLSPEASAKEEAREEASVDKKEKKAKSLTEEERKKKRESVLDVNLIPAELAKRPELELPNKLFSSGIIIFIFILLIAAGYLGIVWYQLKAAEQIKQQKVEIDTLDAQIAQLEKQKSAALKLQQRLEVIKQLLDNHVYWTEFFSLLEKYTISEVYYINFSMAGKERLTLSAVGKDYDSVAKQLVAFRQATDFIKSVKIDAARAEIDPAEGVYLGTSFTIDLEFLPGVFKKAR